MKKNKFYRILRLAGAYVACAIGSGFATGQEIIQFFSAQGSKSILGTVVTTLLFAWCGAVFMKHGYSHKLSDPQSIIKFYFGDKSGKYVEIVIQVFLFGVYCIMIAGAGATLQEHYGISPITGRAIMSILCVITVILGLSKLTDILGGVGPVIIAFVLFIGIESVIDPTGTLSEANELVATSNIVKTEGGWLWSSILYPGYNAIIVLFLCCSIGKEAESENEAVWGGVLGGLLFGAAITIMNVGLLLNLGEIYTKAVPTLELARKMSSLFAVVFSIIICCGIYTTAVPMLWGCVRHFAEDRTKKSVVFAALICAAGFLLGLTDFRTLVNIIYPFSGYFGIVLLIIAGYRDYQSRNKKL